MAKRRKNRTRSKVAPVARGGTATTRAAGRSAVPAAPALQKAPAGRRFRAPTRLVGALGTIQTRSPVLLLTGLSLGLCGLIFPPVGWWWLAYVCLVPWLVCVCMARSPRFLYFVSFLLGFGYFLIHIRWLIPVTMDSYLAGYLLPCAMFGILFPLAAWPIRHMYRRHGISVALTAPVAWVAVEYLRSIGPLGFPFVLLGHSQYKILTVIQISDLAGAYGVSFVLMMVNGWITDLLIQPILIWRSERATRLPVGSLTTLLVVAGTLIYGSAQRSKGYFTPGPKVAVVQHDFPMYVDERAVRTHPDTIFRAYLALARQAAAEKPDLIVLPETAISCFINDEFLDATTGDLQEIQQRRFPHRPKAVMKAYQQFSRRVRDAFQKLSTQTGVPMVLGFSSLEWKPTAIPPGVQMFNSAFLLKPGETRPVARYDKNHLVLFGEYVPFRTTYYPLYKWLNSMTPWGGAGIEYSLTAGSEFNVFEFDAASQNQRRYRAGVPICYEECMPYIARAFTRGSSGLRDGKNIDMLLTISNDGWFLHSAELEQHLVTAVFRAIENRIAVARSVNTGASAQIHPNGKIHDLVVLAEANIEHLEPLAAALERLREPATRLEAGPNDRTTLEELSRICSGELRSAARALGPTFAFVDERLRILLSEAAGAPREARTVSARAFREQIDSDLGMIGRWKEKPWTAPGYLVANMQLDDRITIYSRWGDWFAQGALALLAMMLVDWLLRRLLNKDGG